MTQPLANQRGEVKTCYVIRVSNTLRILPFLVHPHHRDHLSLQVLILIVIPAIHFCRSPEKSKQATNQRGTNRCRDWLRRLHLQLTAFDFHVALLISGIATLGSHCLFSTRFIPATLRLTLNFFSRPFCHHDHSSSRKTGIVFPSSQGHTRYLFDAECFP